MKSGIFLSGVNVAQDSSYYEGIVTSNRLFQLDLRGTQLVMFSTCNSGLGDIKSFEGVEGLNKAVINARADRVTVTLWAINDEVSVEFVKIFYQYIKEKIGYSKALQKN